MISPSILVMLQGSLSVWLGDSCLYGCEGSLSMVLGACKNTSNVTSSSLWLDNSIHSFLCLKDPWLYAWGIHICMAVGSVSMVLGACTNNSHLTSPSPSLDNSVHFLCLRDPCLYDQGFLLHLYDWGICTLWLIERNSIYSFLCLRNPSVWLGGEMFVWLGGSLSTMVSWS